MRFWIFFAALSGLMAVGFGAIASHAFDPITGLKAKSWVETAAHYQGWHGLAILCLAIMSKSLSQRPSKLLMLSLTAFTLGIIWFSGSLYLRAFFNFDLVASITPIGGMLFMLGWASLLIYSLTHKFDK
jgi:uncharacterized membrane protein YgdD (TMEM256/DUF423 family)